MNEPEVTVEVTPAPVKPVVVKATPAELKLQKELSIANDKAAMYFNELQALKKQIEEDKNRSNTAAGLLFKSIEIALNNFNLTK